MRANERASGSVLTSGFLIVLDHSARVTTTPVEECRLKWNEIDAFISWKKPLFHELRSEWVSGRTTEWPSTYVLILGCFEP